MLHSTTEQKQQEDYRKGQSTLRISLHSTRATTTRALGTLAPELRNACQGQGWDWGKWEGWVRRCRGQASQGKGTSHPDHPTPEQHKAVRPGALPRGRPAVPAMCSRAPVGTSTGCLHRSQVPWPRVEAEGSCRQQAGSPGKGTHKSSQSQVGPKGPSHSHKSARQCGNFASTPSPVSTIPRHLMWRVDFSTRQRQ